MASAMLKDRSASAAIPAFTGGASDHRPIPSFLQPAFDNATWFYTTLAIIAGLLVLEQSVYRFKKGHLPGDKWVIPVIGKFMDSLNPTMEGYMAQWANALTALSVFNIFIVMASSNDYSRRILNSPTHAEPCLVNSMKAILRPDNWVFFTGKAHVEYRRVLNSMFTRKALGMYLTTMDRITREHFAEWLAAAKADPSPKEIMRTARDLNMDTSLRVFCGPHITKEQVREIGDKFWVLTAALELVNFPLAVPGTKVYRAVQCRKVALGYLEEAAAKAKAAIAGGKEPECMIEEWIKTLADPAHKGRRDFSNLEIAMVVFSFLLASQDAMSSGLIYGFQHLTDHPEIFAKVREEQDRVRGGDYERAVTLEMMDEMPYLRAFVKESLRMRPPVTMVPYKTTKAFPLAEDYTVPNGTIIIPSFWNSLHDPEVYPEPEELLPERWLDPEGSANMNPKNYIGFGAGPHKCIGMEYALMNMGLVLANASALMEMEHVRTPDSEKITIMATLFPKDGCLMKLQPRQHN